MKKNKSFVVFTLDDQKFALHLEAVEKIAQATEIIPLPKAPEMVMGVINVQGRVIPVVDIRKRFQMTEQGIDIDDHFIICRSRQMSIAILVDSVLDIIESTSSNIVEQHNILQDVDCINGVIKANDGMILIHDLDKFLSSQESDVLSKMVKENEGLSKKKKTSKTPRQSVKKRKAAKKKQD
jgi:purine-binding chemotaxis protein CheW